MCRVVNPYGGTDVETEDDEVLTEIDDEYDSVEDLDLNLDVEENEALFPSRPECTTSRLFYNTVPGGGNEDNSRVYDLDRAEVHYLAVANKWYVNRLFLHKFAYNTACVVT